MSILNFYTWRHTQFVAGLRRAALTPRRWELIPFDTLSAAISRRGRIQIVAADLWPGNAGHGQLLLERRYRFAGIEATPPEMDKAITEELPWRATNVDAKWQRAFARFDWLRDLRAAGGDAARAHAQALVRAWQADHRRLRGPVWEPEIIAERLINWLGHTAFLDLDIQGPDQTLFARTVERHAWRLKRTAFGARAGLPRLAVLHGRLAASLALGAKDTEVVQILDLVRREISNQILPDGGHVSRSPHILFKALQHLIGIRELLRAAEIEAPEGLQHAIDRIAPMIRFFRHGDGGFALFNGANEGADWLIDLALSHSEARGGPLTSAPHSGFERLTAGRTLILADTGAPPPAGYDQDAHAGTLSFELSIGRDRMIVNCGARPGDSDWSMALRASAAHSTLVADDRNLARLLSGGITQGPDRVTVARSDTDGQSWLDCGHDGYRHRLRLGITRRLYLSAAGNNLRGEDSIHPLGRNRRWRRDRPFAIRFHLHPSVRASLIQNGSAVLLSPARGPGWRFEPDGGSLTLGESIYFGDGHAMRRSRQIVVSDIAHDGKARVRWGFTRIDKA